MKSSYERSLSSPKNKLCKRHRLFHVSWTRGYAPQEQRPGYWGYVGPWGTHHTSSKGIRFTTWIYYGEEGKNFKHLQSKIGDFKGFLGLWLLSYGYVPEPLRSVFFLSSPQKKKKGKKKKRKEKHYLRHEYGIMSRLDQVFKNLARQGL